MLLSQSLTIETKRSRYEVSFRDMVLDMNASKNEKPEFTPAIQGHLVGHVDPSNMRHELL